MSFSCTTLTGGTYNGLIINKSTYAAFSGVYSPLGIVGEEPTAAGGTIYRKVTFDLAGGTMDYPMRYFREDGKISNQIKPDPRTGYTFAGWYKADGTVWDYNDTVGEDDLTLTAHWTACDHSGHTEAQPTCTTSVICTECGGTIAALGHDFSMQHNNDEHWNKCSRCDAIYGKEPHDWDNGKVTVPASCTTSGEKKYTCDECGFKKIETIQANGHSWGQEWQHDKTHHWHKCRNCDVKLDYNKHTGGTVTCTEKAKCEVCHENYGEKNSANHNDGKQEWTKTETAHEKKWSCCGVVTVASEPHKWTDGVCQECGYVCSHYDNDKNHICDICGKIYSNHEDTDKNHICDYCGKTISNHDDTDKNHICNYCGKMITNHTGGKATCKDKAVCDYCGKAYGELDASNHANLKHIPAKAATKEAEGNIEYWYCEGCDKYYSDAEALNGIVKGSILIMKLTDEPKSPKTGDSSSHMPWTALLFIGGGVCAALTVKKKKQSKK